jgi:hypothetical protein
MWMRFSDVQRHDRLMTQLRKPYLAFFATLILGLLPLIFIAVQYPGNPGGRSLRQRFL